MKAHLPVSEAEDTAAILCVEPLASSSSAPLLLLLLASTVDSSCCLFRKRRDLSGVRKAGSSNASWLSLSLSPSFYCSVTSSIFCFLCLPPASPSLLIPPLPFNFSPSFFLCVFKSIIFHTPFTPVWLFRVLSSVKRPSLLFSSSARLPASSFFCLSYQSEHRGKIVQCRRLEAKSTPAAAAPGRCLVIFFFKRQNRGSWSSHLLVSHSSSSSSVALYADCSQEDR